MIISNLEVQNQCKIAYATNGILQTDNVGIISAVPSISSAASWSPLFSNSVGILTLTTDVAYYQKIGNIVSFGVSLAITTSGLSPSFDMSLPVSPSANFTSSNQVTANGSSYSSTLLSLGGDPLIRSLSGSLNIRATFPTLSIGSWVLRINGQYTV